MRKLLFLCIVIIALAITIETDSNVTGLFLRASSTILEIARYILKEILTFIASLL